MDTSQKESLELKIWEFLLAGNIQKAIEFAFVGDRKTIFGYGNELYQYTLKQLKDEELAKDVFSLFAQQICQSIGTFRQESSFRSWAYVVLKNTIIKYKQTSQKKDFRPISIKNANDSLDSSFLDSIPESKIQFDGKSLSLQIRQEQEKSHLKKLIATLPIIDQNILDMLLYQYMSYEEIAEVLSKQLNKKITEAFVRQRYHRAQETLKKLAQEAGYT